MRSRSTSRTTLTGFTPPSALRWASWSYAEQRQNLVADNVKLTSTRSKGLGTYLEIEAIGQRNLGEVVLRRQSSESLDLLASTASTASGTSSHGDLNECCQRPAADSVRERQLGQTKQTRRVHDIIRDAKLRWLVRTECSQEGICASHVI